MVNEISKYTEIVLCLSIFISIIQMILPNGKMKRSVVFICALIVTIVTLEPVIKLLKKDFNFYEVFELNREEYEIEVAKRNFEMNYDEILKDTFRENLNEDIVSRLKKAGYKVNSVKSVLDDITMEPKELKLEIETDDGFVQRVRIEVMGQNKDEDALSSIEEYEIKKILCENYGVDKSKIYINGR